MKPISIDVILFHPISYPLVEPLRTSFGVEPDKTAVILEVKTRSGITGWGEVSVEIQPNYGPETIGTSLHVLRNFIQPALIGKTIHSPTDIPAILQWIRGNNHTKAGVEAAIWDAMAQRNNARLADFFSLHLPEGHTSKNFAEVGVSIGIQPSVDETLAIIKKRLNQGYQRIKLKIRPGWDVELIEGVRAALPDITLMVDANSAYTLDDAEHLKKMDEFNVLMMEQPLTYNDIYEHSLLQAQLKTPICLDESIKSNNDLKMAWQIGACRILNLKPARVGGFKESLEIYKTCISQDIPLWIGGMMETGLGRAANVAFASLPGITLPSDISATDRYFAQDITEPPFVLGDGASLAIPSGVGIGVEVQRERLQAAMARWQNRYPYLDSEFKSE